MSRRIDALTGIRAFAALAVLIYHYQFYFLTGRISDYGYLGVDLFFILSGFVIAHAHLGEFASLHWATILRFYGLRLARIYPVHFVILIGLVCTVITAGHFGVAAHLPSQFTANSLWANLLLIHAWGPWPLSWNFPAWSISCEWAAYLLCPLLCFGLIRITRASQALWPARRRSPHRA